MSEQIKVGMADYKVSEGPNRLITLGLGSCIGITVYDKRRKIGGMAHIMLPKNPDPTKSIAKFADTAIEAMLNDLANMGAGVRSLEAKLAGGAQMFTFSSSNEMNSIGYRNAEAVKQELKKRGVKIIAEETGGGAGRTIELDLEDGKLKIKTMGSGEKYI
jgi:chemotaxis protein CheD